MNCRWLRIRSRRLVRRSRRFLYHNVLHADDPPHRIAMGAAIGMFVTFTPTVGFQMVLTAFFSWLLRANKIVGLPIVWLSNPATMVPMFYGCYVVGLFILRMEPISAEWWEELYSPPEGWWPTVKFYWTRLADIALPLWGGCLVVATGTAIPTYYAVLLGVRTYRLRKWGQLMPPGSRHADPDPPTQQPLPRESPAADDAYGPPADP